LAFERSGANLFLPWSALQGLGLALERPPDANDSSPADLSQVRGLTYRINTAEQLVTMVADPSILPHRTLDAGGPVFQPPDRAAWGGAFDYAANVEAHVARLGGQVRAFGPLGVVSHSFTLDARRGGGYRRLDTNLVIDDYARGRTLVLGDFVSGALP